MEPVSRRRWQLRSAEPMPELIEALAADLSIAPLIARLLALRGIQEAGEGRQFLESRLQELPDPFLLPGMAAAVQRLDKALENGERIAVHGDYDVDGITGTALLVENLRRMGAEVDFHIPLRLRDGYGLSAEALRRAAADGARLAVSVDCGISATTEAGLATELGLDLIITDHHQPPASLPAAVAIVNPHLPGSDFPFAELAGVGVAFFLLIALRKVLRDRGAFADGEEPDLRRSLDLVALGTIADLVPLRGINRTLTRVGLGVLERGGRPGIRALRRVAEVREVTCGAVGFRLAPRLNAAGRLEDASLGVELLLSAADRGEETVAQRLDCFNRERQNLEEETLQQALERLETIDQDIHSIVLGDQRWHPGVIGIVASRLVERFHRPTVLIALEEDGRGKGSARSIPGFHLYQALKDCEQHLEGYGGHQFAAGLSLDGERLEAFAASFEEQARSALAAEDLQPRLDYDGEVLLEELAEALVEQVSELAPFGIGNPEPVFLLRQVRVQQARVVGRNHLQFTVRQGGYSCPCIAFGMAERQDELAGEIDLLAAVGINTWKGRRSVQLRVRDFRQATGEQVS